MSSRPLDGFINCAFMFILMIANGWPELQVIERLFVVSQPSPFPDNILKDAFCRFGGLIDAHFMTGRNKEMYFLCVTRIFVSVNQSTITLFQVM